ncbi:zinc/iron permease [Pelomyxa schiedti]|nr:zinc/iron permease [Pelomyxa schiedti]
MGGLGTLEGDVVSAIGLTTVAGLSTGIGGVLAFVVGAERLGHMLSFSVGVMVYVSFADLLIEAIAEIGFGSANLAFFLGMIAFHIVVLFVPEPDLGSVVSEPPPNKEKHTSSNPITSEGSELRKRKNVKPPTEITEQKKTTTKSQKKSLIMVGLITALGISLHNFPEGIAVYLSCLKGVSFGLPLAFVIACHNIPEGMAVAAPIYSATGSKWKSIKWATLSGICEPAGAILVILLLHRFITPYGVNFMLAFVGGIMVYMSICELLPTTFEYLTPIQTFYGVLTGMITIFGSVYVMRLYTQQPDH